MVDINIPDVIKSTAETEQVKNLTVPATKSIGQALGDIFDLCFGDLHSLTQRTLKTLNKN